VQNTRTCIIFETDFLGRDYIYALIVRPFIIVSGNGDDAFDGIGAGSQQLRSRAPKQTMQDQRENLTKLLIRFFSNFVLLISDSAANTMNQRSPENTEPYRSVFAFA
jgi:hypothetical protein